MGLRKADIYLDFWGPGLLPSSFLNLGKMKCEAGLGLLGCICSWEPLWLTWGCSDSSLQSIFSLPPLQCCAVRISGGFCSAWSLSPPQIQHRGQIPRGGKKKNEESKTQKSCQIAKSQLVWTCCGPLLLLIPLPYLSLCPFPSPLNRREQQYGHLSVSCGHLCLPSPPVPPFHRC